LEAVTGVQTCALPIYICRTNPLEANIRVYVVQNGVRRQLGTARSLAEYGSDYFKGTPALTVNSFGKGKVGAVYGPVASIYFRSHHPWLREFIGGLAAELFPDPAVKVGGPYCLDLSLRTTRDGRLSVHLLNTAGMPLPDRYGFTDFIPPLEDIRLTVKTPAKPKSVTWIPDGGTLEWSWSNGLLKVTVPKLKIHGIVVWD
jgi:hypothetical protein